MRFTHTMKDKQLSEYQSTTIQETKASPDKAHKFTSTWVPLVPGNQESFTHLAMSIGLPVPEYH